MIWEKGNEKKGGAWGLAVGVGGLRNGNTRVKKEIRIRRLYKFEYKL